MTTIKIDHKKLIFLLVNSRFPTNNIGLMSPIDNNLPKQISTPESLKMLINSINQEVPNVKKMLNQGMTKQLLQYLMQLIEDNDLVGCLTNNF